MEQKLSMTNELSKRVAELEFIMMNAAHDAVKTLDQEYLLIEGMTSENWLIKAVNYSNTYIKKPELSNSESGLMVLTSNKGYYVGSMIVYPSDSKEGITIEPKPIVNPTLHLEMREALDELMTWQLLGYRTENRNDFILRLQTDNLLKQSREILKNSDPLPHLEGRN